MNSLEELYLSMFSCIIVSKCTMFSFQEVSLTLHISMHKTATVHQSENFGKIILSLESHFSHSPKTHIHMCNTYTSIFEVLLHVIIVSSR